MPVYSAQHYLSDCDRCLAQLVWAFRQLQISVPRASLQAWSSLIVDSISGPARYFHGPEHTLRLAATMIAEGHDGLAVLAALFHDVVYGHVDGGLPQPIMRRLRSQVRFEADGVWLAPPRTPAQQLVAMLFDLPPLTQMLERAESGASLTCDGSGKTSQLRAVRLPLEQCNELLSAWVAADCLGEVLSLRQIAEIAVAIEATIPFRPSENGQRPGDRALQRLHRANQRFGLGLSTAEMNRAICRSVHLTNADLSSFAAEDPTYFLDQTWLILPELTPALRNPRQYRVRDYREAVRRMEGFLNGLEVSNIFQRFHGIPETEVYRAMVARARHNLAVGSLYLRTKVVAIALLEALVNYQRSNVPLQDLLGPASNLCQVSLWEQRFPQLRLGYPLSSTIELKVMQIAEEGRITPCGFDLVRSPLAALLIRSVGFERIQTLRQQADRYFEGGCSAEDLLCCYEAKVVQTLSQTIPRLV